MSIVRVQRLSCLEQDKGALKTQRERHPDSEDGRIFHPTTTLDLKQTNTSDFECSNWPRTTANTDLADSWQDLWSVRASRVIERIRLPIEKLCKRLIDIIVVDSFPSSPLLFLNSFPCIYLALSVCTCDDSPPLPSHILLSLIATLLIRNPTLLRHTSCLPPFTSRPP